MPVDRHDIWLSFYIISFLRHLGFFVGKSTAAVTIGQPAISWKVNKELAFSTGCVSKYNQIFAKQVSFCGGYVTPLYNCTI